jgi:predicted RNA-binding Zn-ribbon protein involved in translation (DUF1610 family)
MKNYIIYLLFSYIFIFVSLLVVKTFENIFIVSLILSFVILFLFLLYQRKKEIKFEKKGLLRYTLLCHSCNWEWMSNLTNKKYSKKCPNCGESSKIETIGMRRVHKLPKKSSRDLTSYLKK